MQRVWRNLELACVLITCMNQFHYQPRTQALHCFYRDQRQLINAKRAKPLGQRATKEAPGRKCRFLSSLIVFLVSNVF